MKIKKNIFGHEKEKKPKEVYNGSNLENGGEEIKKPEKN